MDYDIISDMFPEYLRARRIENKDSEIVIGFESQRRSIECPDCGMETSRHTTYFNRTLQDLPIIDKALVLSIRLKKFRCENPDCSRKIFSESIEEIAGEKGRRTKRLNEMLIKLAMTYSAEGASRLLLSKHIVISGDTLLRLVKQWEPTINYEEIEEIGIDDFAFKKIVFTEQFL